MKRKKRGLRSSWMTVVLVLILLGQVQATNHLQEKREWITYYGLDSIEHGLWVYDPLTKEKYLLTNEIGDQYKFSPDGRYLAFLANNQDQGEDKGNTVSLWVRDFTNGTEYAVESDFDTDSNLDAVFEWLQNGDLVVIQPTQSGDKIKILSATGELIWANPKGSQYISHNDQSVLLGQRPDQNLTLFKLVSKNDQLIPVDRLVDEGSLSPKGTFLCYQTSQELILVNLETWKRISIDVGELSDVEFDWSPDENYLLYQLMKENDPQKTYYLNAFNVNTNVKEFEVSSKERILFSWSEDERQMAFGLYKDTWDLFVWFPSRYQTITIQRRLSQAPLPKYRKGTHEFIYLDHVDGSPVVQSYDVDQNILQVIHSGAVGARWFKADWISLDPTGTYQRHSQKDEMYWAGWSEVAEIIYVRPITPITSRKVTNGEQVQRYHQLLKWAPKERLLLIKEDTETYALLDELGEKQVIYQGNRLGEPFWNQDGSMISFVNQKEEKELVLYSIFQDQAFSYPISGKKKLVGWVENCLWFYDGQLAGYDPLRNKWSKMNEWKVFWWPEPKITPAHYLSDVLWQLGGNVWLTHLDSEFRVITRLSDYHPDGWQVKEIHSACWSPDDEEIVFQRVLVRNHGEEAVEEKWEIWTMDRAGQQDRYICDGINPQWLGNHQIIFLKDGDLYSANLVTGQIVGYDSSDLKEQAFMLSYDRSIIAVIALDAEEKAGLYYYRLQ